MNLLKLVTVTTNVHMLVSDCSQFAVEMQLVNFKKKRISPTVWPKTMQHSLEQSRPVMTYYKAGTAVFTQD